MLLIKNFSGENKKNREANNVLLRLNSTCMYEKKEIVDHFKLLYNQLIGMGFKPRIINNCFRLHRFMSLTEAVDYLIKDKEKYVHRFIEKEDSDKKICDLCEEPIESHLEYVNKAEMEKRIERTQSFINISLKRIQSRGVLEVKKSADDIVELHPLDAVMKPLKTLNMKQCEICLDDFDSANIEDRYKFECGHLYCSSCTDEHIKTEIINGRVKKINCPYTNCTFEITETQIASIVKENNPDLFNKYLKFKKNKELEDNPDTIFCPHPDCEGFVIYEHHEERLATKIECQFGHPICTRCGEVWHAEQKCEKQMDEEIEKLVMNHQLRLKRCPGCTNWTQKNSGCNHMTCIFCQFQWCWLCNQKYTPTHYNTPGTRCNGKQFPQNNGQYEWEDYDPELYERARKGIEEPIVDPDAGAVEQPVNIVALEVRQPPEPRTMTNEEYLNFSAANYHYSDGNCLGNITLDILYFTLLSVCNFIGNGFMLIYVWKSLNFIDINSPFRNMKLVALMYYFSCFVLWTIYFITILGSSIAAFTINMANSVYINIKMCCNS